ncbi:tetratricopeptide repeat protein [Sphingobacterium rhinopitheci]|uniref:tetratricopeptide repeat protein n=1 Tax=Sphingobacterium rhinopitheci TaxID=2781960 RepID=UPI001F51E1A9|nr:tetratricopeptide repeat protein [Sphingobacterium rhinopitheci]MCI0921048.1 tetratricopeptide repeat protein [Sphingobacterium rhinopitheci]
MSTNINSTEKKGSFFQDNIKSVIFIGGAIIVLILLYIGYQKIYLAPRADEAADAMFKAEEFALIDSLQKKAIDGDGSFLGFQQIADEYSNTPSANIANAYLGGLYLRQQNFQEAIKYLKKYSETGSEILDPLVIGLIGDAYSESHDYKNAADYYKKAAEKSSNSFTTPLFLKKLGLVYEQLDENKSAADAYNKIKVDFPESNEASTIDGPLARAEAKQ